MLILYNTHHNIKIFNMQALKLSAHEELLLLQHYIFGETNIFCNNSYENRWSSLIGRAFEHFIMTLYIYTYFVCLPVIEVEAISILMSALSLNAARFSSFNAKGALSFFFLLSAMQ